VRDYSRRAPRGAVLLVGLGTDSLVGGIGSARPSAFRVSRSDVSAAAQRLIVLRFRFPGMCSGCGLLLRGSHLALSLQAHGNEDQQNSDGDDGKDSAHCGPFLPRKIRPNEHNRLRRVRSTRSSGEPMVTAWQKKPPRGGELTTRTRGAADEFLGKVVVVTGAGSGIGRATALLFARLGAKAHVADIRADRAEAVRKEIEARGGRAVAHQLDVSDSDSLERLAERVFNQDGLVNVLHNNAGIAHAGPVEETPLEEWERLIGVNLLGTIYGIHSFVPRMLRQGHPAHIVNTASLSGLVATAQMAPYCASKFGVVGLSEALGAELAPKGIHVTALCPGSIDTAILDEAFFHGVFLDHAEGIRGFFRSRGASPDLVAEAVLEAVRRKRPIQTVPKLQVHTAWLLKRISPRASQAVSRQLPRLAAFAERLPFTRDPTRR
jgi:NAD(P)-dependent dehydrogenase (short-subunit alcohol dehydrogenase family)